jgi:hypothetical protein
LAAVSGDDRDVVVEAEADVPTSEDPILDAETIRKLDAAIALAFQSGGFDDLMELINNDPQLVDYKVSRKTS